MLLDESYKWFVTQVMHSFKINQWIIPNVSYKYSTVMIQFKLQKRYSRRHKN